MPERDGIIYDPSRACYYYRDIHSGQIVTTSIRSASFGHSHIAMVADRLRKLLLYAANDPRRSACDRSKLGIEVNLKDATVRITHRSFALLVADELTYGDCQFPTFVGKL